jgi:hypothetical protein
VVAVGGSGTSGIKLPKSISAAGYSFSSGYSPPEETFRN